MRLLAVLLLLPLTAFADLTVTGTIIDDDGGTCSESQYYDSGLDVYFPDDSCAGVQAGETLTPSGSVSTSSNGQTIENLEITGSITVNHNNVTIRNVKLNTSSGVSISNGCSSGGADTLIEYVEIDGTGHTTGASAIDCGQFTVRYVYVHDYGEVVGCPDGDATIEWNYFVDFSDQTGSGAHQDGVQCEGGSNVFVRHNTIIMNVDGGNSAIVFGGDTEDMTAEYNLVGGGGFTLYQGQAGGTFRFNRFTTVGAGDGFGPVYPSNLDGPWDPQDPCNNLWFDGPDVGEAVEWGGSTSC